MSLRRPVLGDWVDAWAAEAPDRVAVVAPDGRPVLTYAALAEQAGRLARALGDLGVGPGDTVAAQLPNCAEFIVAYVAAGRRRAVLQTVHMPYRAAEIESLLAHSGAVAAIAVSAAKDYQGAQTMLEARARGLGSLREVIAVGPGAPPRAHAFDALLASSPAAAGDPSPAQPDDRYLLLYTSGTTAAPKGVQVSYRRFLVNAERAAAELRIEPRSVLLSAAPFTHLYGLFSLNLALSAGAAVALLPAFAPAALDDAVRRTQATGLFLAPAHVASCLAAGLLPPESLTSVRFAMVSGSACPPELARDLQARLPATGRVLQLWGMSELQAGAFTRPGDPLELRTTTVGRASPGTELRIVGDDRRPVGPDDEGELQMRGESLFDGYLRNADADAVAFTADGWFRTGDLGRIDADGYLAITGRSKELINRGGVKFNPVDVELIVQRHPAVAECAIVPMPDPVLGERACCFVTLRGPASGEGGLTLAALREWLAAQRVAKLKWPERLAVLDEMPTTPTRKVRKGELARLARELGEAQPPDRA